MSTLLKKARKAATANPSNSSKTNSKTNSKIKNMLPRIQDITYTFHPVTIPKNFLAPLSDPSRITVQKIDFENSVIPEYKGLYAVVLENVLTEEECGLLIRFAEMSAGGHREGEVADYREGADDGEDADDGRNGEKSKHADDDSPKNHAAEKKPTWVPALVSAGPGQEFSAPEYRNSDRIVWDNAELASRIWERCAQAEGIREELMVLRGGDVKEGGGGKDQVLGGRRGRDWKLVGLNERLRFLRYGGGQFFREHCDGEYTSPTGQTSFYTLHLYLNNSLQVLPSYDPTSKSKSPFTPLSLDSQNPTNPVQQLCQGGATTFHSHRHLHKKMDIDPKIGRVLIFQQKRLLHSGDDVISGTKYTMRSDLMFEMVEKREVGKDGDGDGDWFFLKEEGKGDGKGKEGEVWEEILERRV